MPFTSALSVDALVPSGLGFRNSIINGDFSVDQRNNGNQQVITAGAALAYTVDRWYAYCTGANIAVRQQTASTPLRFRYQMAGSVGNTGAFLGQRIEAANSYHFAGKIAALSVYLQSSTITSVNWAVYRANTTDTFGTVASPTRTLIASGSLPVTSSMTRQSVLMDIPTAATTGLEVVFSVPTLGGLDILFLGNVQFEANNVVTSFEQRQIGFELNLCQRYFQSITTSGDLTSYNPYWNVGLSGGDQRIMYPFKVRMRIAPTVLTTSGSAIHQFQYRNYNTGTANYNLECGAGMTSVDGIMNMGYYSTNNGSTLLPVGWTTGTNNNAMWISAEL